MIKTIFFDIGGVLIDIHPNRTYQYVSDCIGIDVQVIQNSFPNHIHDKYEKGEITSKEWFLLYKDSLPQPCCLKETDFWKAWRLLLGEEKKTIEIIKNLKDRYSIWLLSNTNSKHIQDEIENKYSFPKLVNGAIYSFEAGLRKPDAYIYKHAAEQARQDPQSCLFIDDLNENIRAAKKFGMHAFHFTSTEKLKKDLISIGIECL